MATVRFDHVGKSFDGVAALTDVELTIGEGEFVVWVGPSGCGKSTALRLIAGLEEPDTGRICIDGVDMRGVPPKDRGCAMVFQSYALYPHWTVFGNLAFPLQLKRVPKKEIKRRVVEIARDLKIDDVLERRPKALSGGQRQRVALGRAMAANPKVFLFDEPLSNLDAPLRAAMRGDIVARQKTMRKTTIYVTHDQAEALTMADRVVVLDRGHVRGIGPPEQLYRNPPNRFVASFLGRPTINLVPGRIRESADGPTFDPCGWPLPERTMKTIPTGDLANVQLGIRAEHLSLRPTTNGAPATIVAREFFGDKILYRIRMSGRTLTVLTDAANRFDPATPVSVLPATDHMMFFRVDDGARLA